MIQHIKEGEVALPDLKASIAAALAGDSYEWGYLYTLAGLLLSRGKALPEPLRSAIADRLTAVGEFLIKPKMGDARHVLEALICTSGPQKPGRRTRLDRVQKAAEAVADVLEIDNSRGRRKAMTELMAATAGVNADAVDKRLNAVRKARREK